MIHKKNLTPTIAHNKSMRFLLNRREYVANKVYRFIEILCKQEGFSKNALDYLKGPNRKLKFKTIRHFRLMEIQNPWWLSNCLKKHFSKTELITSGVFNDNFRFVFYNHRILIPYCNGEDIKYLRGRYFPNVHEKNNKYIGVAGFTVKRIYNSDILAHLKPGQRLYITEGEFDCQVLFQAGYKNVIGIPGVNSLPIDEMINNNLSQYRLFVVGDNDNAGDKMARKVADGLGVRVKKVKLRNGKDLTEVYNEEK